MFVILAIGANLAAADGTGPLQACVRAVQSITGIPGLTSIVRSRWFSSAAIPPSGQPRYINGVVRADAAMPPDELLGRLQAIENAAGRIRQAENAARTLDLDIIDMGGLLRTAPDPILPHPRAHLRAFVLRPLRDVAPDWTHPVTGESVRALLQGLPPQDIVAC